MDGNIEKMQSLTGRIKGLGIDKTLTKKGMCAEAEATGKALATKVSITDIVDDLLSVASDKPLSANQGRLLKKLIDEIDPHYAENVLYNDTNVKDALDKVSKAENIAYDGDKSVQVAIDECVRTLGYTVSKNYLSLSNVTTVTGAEQVTVNADVVSIKGALAYQTYACHFGNYSLKKDSYTLSCVTNDYTGNGSKCGWRVCVNGSWWDISYSDTYTFELDSDSVVGVAYYSSVSNETSIDKTCTISQPMLCKASEDNTYEPYVPSVADRFNNKVNISELPFTAPHSGIATVVIQRGIDSAGIVGCVINIYKNNVKDRIQYCYSYVTKWGACSFTIPLAKDERIEVDGAFAENGNSILYKQSFFIY